MSPAAVTPHDVMTRYVAAIRSEDRAAAFALLAPDAVGHVPGRSSHAGELRGRDAVVGYIEAALARAGDDVEIEVLDMLVGEEHVALLVRERLGEVEIRRANVYRVEDGAIREIRIFEADQHAVDAWLP